MNRLLILFLTFFVLTGCSEKNSNDALETFRYWSGTQPSTDLKLLKGQYWQSGNWSNEYIMYLKFKPTEKWWTEFIKQNNILVEKEDLAIPDDAPTWFIPSTNSIRFGGGGNFDQGSRYLRDTITGICLIYEIQL